MLDMNTYRVRSLFSRRLLERGCDVGRAGSRLLVVKMRSKRGDKGMLTLIVAFAIGRTRNE